VIESECVHVIECVLVNVIECVCDREIGCRDWLSKLGDCVCNVMQPKISFREKKVATTAFHLHFKVVDF